MRHIIALAVVVLSVWTAGGIQADPPGSGSGSGATTTPSDPGLVAKTPQSFGGDVSQLRAYVDSVYRYGHYLYRKGDLSRAKKYWSIIQRNFPEATDVIVLIENNLSDAEAAGSGPGKDPSFEDDPVPPASGSGSDPGESVPPPVDCVPPVETPDGSGSGSGSGVRREAPDPEEVIEQKKNAEDAKKLVRQFSVRSFRIGSNPTTAGAMPELFLSFECLAAPRYVTIVFYGYTDKGKVFRVDRTFLGPDVGVTHKIAAAYKIEWIAAHGKLISGHVEICCGKSKTCAVISSHDLEPKKAPKEWWKKDPTDRFGFYKVGQHPEESGTLKRIPK